MGASDPWGVASLDPRGFVGRISVGDHLTILMVSEKKNFQGSLAI